MGAAPPRECTRSGDSLDADCEATEVPNGASVPRPRRLSWAQLLQRVFAVDAFLCPVCGGRLRLLAAIQSPDAIRAILNSMDLPARAPPLAPAEPEVAAPEFGFEDVPLFDE